jgi:alanine dehydrogenase
MALYLSDEDVRSLLPMAECIEVLDDLFRQEARGLVQNMPRDRIRLPHSAMTIMGGSVLGSEAYGVRHSSLTVLYNTETGKLDALMPPGSIAWIRTGAASGVATKYMARPDAAVVGLLGTGRQAVTQLEAVCAVRPISLIRAFSRNEDNRNRFAAEMRERLGVDVVPVASAAECLRGAHIVITITNTRDPVLEGALLEPGMHINAAGANSAPRRELDETAVERADRVVVDNLEQAKMECGDLIWPAERGLFNWRKAFELHEVVGGKTAGRQSDTEITLFESQGIGIEDVAASAYVLRKARERGIGQELPF